MTLNRQSLQGLTLVELLVVLSILAVLSTVAIRSVSDQAIETRYDANLDQLEAIKEAIIGDGEDFNGFVGDVGSIPRTDSDLYLDKLTKGENCAPYGFQTPAGDSEIQIACGWRGPYLDLGFNQLPLTDGFGHTYTLLKFNGNPVDTASELIGTIATLGLSNTVDGTDLFEQDAAIVFQDNSAENVNTTVKWFQDIRVEVSRSGENTFNIGDILVIRIYGPGVNSNTNIAGIAKTVAQNVFTFDASTQTHDFTFKAVDGSTISYGPKIIRAYLYNSGTTLDESDIGFEDNLVEETEQGQLNKKANLKSQIINRTIGQFSDTLVKFEL